MRETSSRPSSLGLINKALETSEWEGNGKELLLLPYNELRQRLLLLSVSSHLSLTSRASRAVSEHLKMIFFKWRKRRERSISPWCCCCIFLLYFCEQNISLAWLHTTTWNYWCCPFSYSSLPLLSCSLSSLKASLQSLRRLWWCLTTRWMGGWMGRWVGFVYTRSAH
jgi:hypothetical protein